MSTVHALRPTRTPGRPGPGPLPAALLRKVNLTVRRRIDGLLAGDHRAWATGDGTELAQVRPYTPGDDVRLIDWNVTARTGEPHVRVNVAERAVETWLLLDTSASMQFGTADRRKSDVAEGAALAIGHLATRRGNRLGIVTFGDVDADVRLARPRGDVPVDQTDVVAGHVGTHLRQLRTVAVEGRAVVTGQQSLHPAADRDVERPQQGIRHRARAGPVWCRCPPERVHAALARFRSICGTGTSPITPSRIESGVTSSASAWYVRTRRWRSASLVSA